MSSTQVILEIQPPIARITFSTEGGVNVLGPEVMTRLGDVLTELRGNREVRATIIGAAGKVYAAGADIKAMSKFDFDAAHQYARLGADTLSAVESLPSITIAAINGAALGGGLELALACDFRIAVRTAKVGLPEVTLGLIPGWAGTLRLPRLIGPARARQLILSGVPIKAEDGVPIGLIDEVVNSVEDLAPRAEAFARSFFSAGPRAVAAAKRAFLSGDDESAFADCFDEHADGPEGMAAFIEKRKARWVPG